MSGGGGTGGAGSAGAVSAQIQVVYESLNSTATQLTQAVGIIDEVTAHHDPLADQASAAGDPKVTGAITSFLHTWSYGLGCMKSDAKELSSDLAAAARRYQQLEAAIAKAAHKGR
ncbi:MAG TPA: hypothetical protein VG435_13295 [Acidimicrobiales bacterium]|jgi:hypothetical protein|nr:hypothetical protein [Acidimicrobiales bacterium]